MTLRTEQIRTLDHFRAFSEGNEAVDLHHADPRRRQRLSSGGPSCGSGTTTGWAGSASLADFPMACPHSPEKGGEPGNVKQDCHSVMHSLHYE